MKQKATQQINDFFISFFLPSGMTDWFEITRMEEVTNTGKEELDVLYSSI